MPTFTYTALTKHGETVHADIDAEHEGDALVKVMELGYFITSIEPADDSRTHPIARSPFAASSLIPIGGPSETSAAEALPWQSNPLPALRIGLGHDTHRLVRGGPLRLGGIDIEFDWHLEGHSDADALLHAITDAILGAASLGDIGELFPDNATENRGRDSAEMLSLALAEMAQAGYAIINIDCIVFAQQPKITPYKPQIRARLAEILCLSPEAINIKAKTGELVGPVGRGEAIQTECVALLSKLPDAP